MSGNLTMKEEKNKMDDVVFCSVVLYGDDAEVEDVCWG